MIVLKVFVVFASLVIYCLMGLLFLKLADFVCDETGLASWVAESAEYVSSLMVAFWPVVFIAWLLTILFSIPYLVAHKIFLVLIGFRKPIF